MYKLAPSLLAAWLAAGVTLHAATAGDPIGFLPISCPGSSDTILSTPLSRTPAYVGTGTGSTLSAGVSGKITFKGTKLFKANEFVYVAGTQPSTYYVFIASGTKAGDYFTITANDTTSVTVALKGDSLAAITAGTKVKIIPYWTLGTLFPKGAGVTASSGTTVNTEILIPDTEDSGTNLPAEASYYYSADAGAWVGGGSTTTSHNDLILLPDLPFTLRNYGSAATTLTATGTVVISQIMIPLNTSASGQQDNYVSIEEPVPISLNDSGLATSGAFTASTSSQTGDQVLVFDNTAVQLNKTPSLTYTFLNGAWTRSDAAGDAGADQVFQPGSGAIIRRNATSEGATSFWTVPSKVSN
jgi:uncharacterized protein (TIGR02597 family)